MNNPRSLLGHPASTQTAWEKGSGGRGHYIPKWRWRIIGSRSRKPKPVSLPKIKK